MNKTYKICDDCNLLMLVTKSHCTCGLCGNDLIEANQYIRDSDFFSDVEPYVSSAQQDTIAAIIPNSLVYIPHTQTNNTTDDKFLYTLFDFIGFFPTPQTTVNSIQKLQEDYTEAVNLLEQQRLDMDVEAYNQARESLQYMFETNMYLLRYQLFHLQHIIFN